MQYQITVPKDILLLVNQLTYDEPLAIGAHAIKMANIQYGETISVVGFGPIGIGMIK